jgi:ribonuclease III/2-amino-4-hydroxy-6-hydroxymethyldihydropteridine diphosphokinase
MSHPIETALGYAFRESRWLDIALSHRSAPLEPNGDASRDTHNERLEFLGDAVLDLGIRALLFRRYPDVSEGELTRYRSFLASGSTLAGIARALHLDGYLMTALRLDNGHPAQRQRALANTLEAILGAIFCDGGFEAAYGVIERLVLPQIAVLESAPFSGNYKSALQEHWQSRYGETPVYEVVGVEGPSHAPYFEMVVRLGEERGELGAGWSKREASQNAARATLERLEREGTLNVETPEPTSTAYLGIGSNVGDRLGFLRAAIAELERNGCRVTRTSSVFETEPVGYTEQGWFLNAVIETRTTLDVHAFHALLKRTEDTIGRRPSVRWGPREIDLDLLLFDDAIIGEERLTLPHAHLHERRFVLVPLAEVAPQLVHPTLGRTIEQLLIALDDPSEVRVYASPDALTPANTARVSAPVP